MTEFDPQMEGVVTGEAQRITDARGVLTKLVADGGWSVPALAEAPRQVLHSATARRGTVRGLHAQAAPYSEAKRIFCLAGAMFWVVVDLRNDSRTFARWQGYELSTGGANALAVPAGFAHGCQALSDDVHLVILADRDYAPDHGIGIAWNDPELAVDWPLPVETALLSAEHAAYPSFAAFRKRHGSL